MENENYLIRDNTITMTGLTVQRMNEEIKTWSEERKELRNEIWLNHGHYHLHDDPTSEGCEECWGRFNEECVERKCDVKDLDEIYGDVSEEDFKRLKKQLKESVETYISNIGWTFDISNSQTT